MKDIETIAKKYNRYGLLMITAMTVLALLAIQLFNKFSYAPFIVLSIGFSMFITRTYAAAWKSVATKAPNTLGKFYMIAPMIKMFAALITIIIGVFIYRNEKEMILAYVGIFVSYFTLLMIYDSVYFFRVEKNSNIKK